MADISKITLPSGSQYNIKDAQARADIATIQGTITGAMSYLGVTTTAITDGSSASTIVIGGENYNAAAGSVVIYGDKQFVFSSTDNKWHEFGDMGSLKALAFKDNASGDFTPAGTVSKPSFTGSETTSTGSFTPTGNVTLTNENQTVAIKVAASGTANYTPAGSVGTPTISLNEAGATTTVKNPTSQTVAKTVVAAAPGATAPANSLTYYSVTGENLSLYQLGYTTGASITTSDVTVKTGDATYTSSQPSWTGTGVRLETDSISVPKSAIFAGTAGTVSVKGTPSGEVSQPTFTGTEGTVTVE